VRHTRWLYVLDGGKARHAAVRKPAGDVVPIQRCQVQKRRNVLDHPGDRDREAVSKKLNEAYALFAGLDTFDGRVISMCDGRHRPSGMAAFSVYHQKIQQFGFPGHWN
jgi:hypothetical protein